MHRLPAVALGIVFVCGCEAREASSSAAASTRSTAAPPPPLDTRGTRVDVVGCWRILDRTGASADQSLDFVPPIVRLDSGAETRNLRGVRPGWRVARRLDVAFRALPNGIEPGIDGVTAWTADSVSDSIRVVFDNAFSGTEVIVAAPRAPSPVMTLRGRASRWTDAGPVDVIPGGPVTLERVSCPAP
jgi:hypothetical protein